MIKSSLELSEALKKTVNSETEKITKVIDLILFSIRNGNKILVCGNGGSAAESQHLVAELVVRFKRERKAIPAISLTTDSSILTACSNDYSFANIFSRQIEALANSGDILICLTTSGKSENLLNAAQMALKKNCSVISFTGINENPLENLSSICIKAQSENTPRIQEIELFLIHEIADIIETQLQSY